MTCAGSVVSFGSPGRAPLAGRSRAVTCPRAAPVREASSPAPALRPLRSTTAKVPVQPAFTGPDRDGMTLPRRHANAPLLPALAGDRTRSP